MINNTIVEADDRSKEIMDTVQSGQAFTAIRDGHRIGELIPMRRRTQFVPRSEFAVMSRAAPGISLAAFRADQDAAFDRESDDPYVRECAGQDLCERKPRDR
ncbi:MULTISPECIES: hypothetical protein [Protofrankia]|uniref:Prevent-host-death family protein n=1 Tax=Candidatus Protofrankia datiscae TaxID=2716812 RepID=F8AYR2_9ACTN|nr:MULTISPECIES: hypothetical protein [Protofrankia]AEH08569.1 hypothetical protein FsymDg_1067 [Candidatus Protofrankia datiscae]